MQKDIVLGDRWREVVAALPKVGEQYYVVDVRLSHHGGFTLSRVAALQDSRGDIRLLIPPVLSSKIIFETDIEAITESKI